MNSHRHIFNTLLAAGMLIAMITSPLALQAENRKRAKLPIGTVVVYPPETVGVPSDVSDAITVALVAELEENHITVYDYRPRFQEMADADESDKPFKLTADVKKSIVADLKATNYLDGRLYRIGNELRLSVTLRKANGDTLGGRNMVLADESDLPIAISRLVESLLENNSVDETLTLDNATKAETKSKPNRFDLEAYVGAMFGLATGIGDIHTFPVIAFDGRFELNKVMIQVDLGLGIHGDATYGDGAIIMNYYVLNTSISPYLGIGGGIFVGDKWAKKGDDSSGTSKFFGGHFFPQIGVEFLRSASIRVHADVRYAVNVSDNRWGHGPVVLAGIAF